MEACGFPGPWALPIHGILTLQVWAGPEKVHLSRLPGDGANFVSGPHSGWPSSESTGSRRGKVTLSSQALVGAGASVLRLVSGGHTDKRRVRIPCLGTEKKVGFQKLGFREQMVPEWREEELGSLQGVGALNSTQRLSVLRVSTFTRLLTAHAPPPRDVVA